MRSSRRNKAHGPLSTVPVHAAMQRHRAGRKQNIQGPSHQFHWRIAEDPLGALVEEQDALLIIDGDDGVIG